MIRYFPLLSNPVIFWFITLLILTYFYNNLDLSQNLNNQVNPSKLYDDLNDNKLYEEISSNSKLLLPKKFNWELTTKTLEEFYNYILKKS